MAAMSPDEDPFPASAALAGDPGRQLLFYAPAGLLGGNFTCSRCGASGPQPDVIEHAGQCSYARPSRQAGGPGAR